VNTQDTAHPSVEPDLREAQRFLNLLDPSGIFTFQTFSDREEMKRVVELPNGKKKKVDPNARIFHGTLDEHSKTLIEMNKRRVGVFVMINKGDLLGRSIGNVVRVRAYFVDLDGAPIEPVLDAPLQPSVLVASSPKRFHAYWMASECPLDEFKARQLMLAQKYGGDPSVAELARVMRLPGFLHNKYDPVMTRIVAPAPGEDLEHHA